MPALIAVEISLGGLPPGIPDGISIFYIYVLSVSVVRNVVVAVTGDPEQPCIFIEGIASAGIGNQCEEVLVSEVIDPGKRRPGGGYNVLPVTIIIFIYIICSAKNKYNRNNDKNSVNVLEKSN